MQRGSIGRRILWAFTDPPQVVEQYFFSHESFSPQRHVFFTTTILFASMLRKSPSFRAGTSNHCASCLDHMRSRRYAGDHRRHLCHRTCFYLPPCVLSQAHRLTRALALPLEAACLHMHCVRLHRHGDLPLPRSAKSMDARRKREDLHVIVLWRGDYVEQWTGRDACCRLLMEEIMLAAALEPHGVSQSAPLWWHSRRLAKG